MTNQLILTEYIFGKVIIITGRPHDLLTNFDLYIFGKVITTTGGHHDLLTTVDLYIFLVRWSPSPVLNMICLTSIYY